MMPPKSAKFNSAEAAAGKPITKVADPAPDATDVTTNTTTPQVVTTTFDMTRVLKDNWRRGGTREFAIVCFMIMATTFAVHRYVVVQDRSTLPIPKLIAELETRCTPQMQAAYQRDPPRLSSGRLMGEDEGGRLPPPSVYGVAIWTDDEALLPPAAAVITEVDKRVSLRDEQMQGKQPKQQPLSRERRYLYPMLRVHKRLRAAFLASHRTPLTDEQDALKCVSELAGEQQLGMASLRHAFAPDIHKETHMVSLSFFSLPASLFPFITNPGERPTWCHSFDVRQSFCVLLTYDDGSYYASDQLDAEIRAAVASVLAYDMRIDSFRPEDVQRWHRVREVKGCIYAIQSLNMLLDSINGNPDMVIPFAVHSVFARLERLVSQNLFVRAARAADDLQFEPLLTPQLYMPMDHSVLSQLLILLPVISMFLLSCRFLLEEKRLDKKRAKLLEADQKTKAYGS